MMKNKLKPILLITVCLCALNVQAAFAGEWIQDEGEAWSYQEDGEMLTGWQYVDGTWYLLDRDTGAWIARPAITAESAPYLLENKLKEQNLYQDEEEELIYRINYETKEYITVSVGYEDVPGQFFTLNIYEIERKTGMAKPVIGSSFSL